MMRRIYVSLLLFALLSPVAGCGQKKATEGGGLTSSSGPAASTAVSKYDAGPRAAAAPVDRAQAEKGEQLFKDKGCSACHTWGRKMSGPDLTGVTQRRTAQWMENQILHPDVMTREDPIARKLMAEMMLQMPNQGLKTDEARAVIEFLKHKDREAAESRD